MSFVVKRRLAGLVGGVPMRWLATKCTCVQQGELLRYVVVWGSQTPRRRGDVQDRWPGDDGRAGRWTRKRVGTVPSGVRLTGPTAPNRCGSPTGCPAASPTEDLPPNPPSGLTRSSTPSSTG